MFSGRTVGPATTSFPAVPADGKDGSNLVEMGKQGMETINKMIPKSGMGVTIAAISVCFTFLFTFCMMCRRCRKRGKGTSELEHPSVFAVLKYKILISMTFQVL